MPKFFVTTDQIRQETITIQNEDVNHIKNVLRAKVDDKIDICDYTTSKNYICKIEKIEDKKIDLEKQKMEYDLKLQKQKDAEAYKREQLKARTALKNQVPGESKKK